MAYVDPKKLAESERAARPYDDVSDAAADTPAPSTAGEGAPSFPTYSIALTEQALTTNAGMDRLLDQLLALFADAVRGVLKDKGTPVNSPVVLLFINLYGATFQCRSLNQPQKIQMTKEQIAQLQREAAGKLLV